MNFRIFLCVCLFGWCLPAGAQNPGFTDAASFGFSPDATGLENVAALQKAVDQTGTIVVSRPGIYKVAGTIFIGSNTTLAFGNGVLLKKVDEAGAFSQVLLNRGALTRTYDEHIVIKGLRLRVNGVDKVFDRVFGLRGQIAFFYVKDLTIEGFRCDDIMTAQFGIHVCTFQDLVIRDVVLKGGKDGIHLGRGRRFTISHAVFETIDDAIALNGHDYATSNPEMGWIEDGLISDCHDLAGNQRLVGYFCRILAGGWTDWKKNMQVQNADAVVSHGRIYRVNGKPDGRVYTSLTAPSHASGTEELDGIPWVMMQAGNEHVAGVRNVTFRDIYLEKPRPGFSIHFDNDRFSRSYYPGAEVPLQKQLVFDGVRVLHDGERSFLSVATPIDAITICHSSFRKGGITFTSNGAMQDYLPTHIDLLGNVFNDTTRMTLLENTVPGKVIYLKATGDIATSSGFVAGVDSGGGKLNIDGDLPGLGDERPPSTGVVMSSHAPQETDARLHAVGRRWGFYQAADTTKKKRVLMIGDSILGGYWEAVSDALKDSVSVDCWITPLHEGDPALFQELPQIAAHGPYDVIHFNIGLHGWQKGRVDESRYASIMQRYIDVLKAGSPRSRLIWASTTPVTVKYLPAELNEAINPIIVRRNKIAGTVMKRNRVAIDDLYGLMVKNLGMARGDMFHWKREGVELEAGAVLACIRRALLEGAMAKGIADRQRLAWWHDAKFGLFIHWGVYSLWAGVYNGHEQAHGGAEWIMNRSKIPVATYRQKAREFNPVRYDPDAWVRMARDAGMKYIVITAKHHDGFALFDSKASGWDVVDATAWGKDLLQPLAAACHKYGMPLGFYYSQAQDWNNPGGAASRKLMSEGWLNPDSARINAYTKEHHGHWDPAQEKATFNEYIDSVAVPQVRELLSHYGPVAVLWWDTPVGMTDEAALKLQKLLALQPGIITNDRLKSPDFPGDTRTPEQQIPDQQSMAGQNWETCMTMNNTWGYRASDSNWKSTQTLVRNLIDVTSKGGNYLLNVGPRPDGAFPEASIERLKEIGQWMRINGEAIYGTQASPFDVLPWGRCTKKESGGHTILYLFVFQWPANRHIRLPGLANKVIGGRLLASGVRVSARATRDGLELSLPAEASDGIATVIKLEVKGTVPALYTVGSARGVKSGALD
ncbi:MAG TPA: alpha-L-fucosidase [Puia sp.]|nr:alpha-L-fucosidase [Puia sp.]